jgi:Flp pilus assembly protein TadG
VTDTRTGRFRRDEDGGFIIFGLAVFMMMCLAGGLAVDVMRYETHRVHVQNTLDRAVLAAASLDQPLSSEEVVLDYFAKAGLGHIISADDLTIDESWVEKTVDGETQRVYTERRVGANLDLAVPTTFLRMADMTEFRMPASGAAEEAVSLTEVSLVLDVSGSMGSSSYSGYSKLYELQRAAKRFVNLMLCDPSDPDETSNCIVEEGRISINVVPYAEQVLLGDNLLSYFNHTAEHTESTCVTFYEDDFDAVGIPAYSASDFANNGRPLPLVFGDPVQLTGYFDPRRGRNDTPRPDAYSPCYNDYSGTSTDAWREVLAFGRTAAELRTKIDSLRASGNTSIDLGMKWGAALLDPAAQPAISGMIASGDVHEDFAGRPYNYSRRGIEKVIVLMTDGENTSQDYLREGFHSGPSGVYKANSSDDWSVYDAANDRYYWADGGQWLDHPYGEGEHEECSWTREYYGYYWWQYDWVESCDMVAEGDGATQLTFTELWREKTTAWYDQWSFLNDAAASFNYYEKNNNLDAICDAVKAEGMVVFAIGFEVSDSQDDIMRNCASAPSYYFDVNGLDISDAFAAIAREISKLRLVN